MALVDQGSGSLWDGTTITILTQQIVDTGEGHHQRGHKEVRNGQGGQEQVANATQTALRVDGQADQDVSGHREEYQHR